MNHMDVTPDTAHRLYHSRRFAQLRCRNMVYAEPFSTHSTGIEPPGVLGTERVDHRVQLMQDVAYFLNPAAAATPDHFFSSLSM